MDHPQEQENAPRILPADHEPDKTDAPGPRYMLIKLDAILEPALPARATMDDHKMEELIESMDELGQLQPISLEQRGEKFEIITGHRRFLAARELRRRYQAKKELRWTCMHALVYYEGQMEMLASRLHENAVREDLNPAEEAVFMQQALEMKHLDLEGLCRLFHKSEGYINSRFALLRGDMEIFDAVAKGDITLGAAHQLNRISDEAMRRHYLAQAKLWSPPGRVVEGWVREWQKTRQPGLQMSLTSPEQTNTGPVDVYRHECALCGGYKDPGNLITIVIHSYEWERILQQVQKAMAGGQ